MYLFCLDAPQHLQCLIKDKIYAIQVQAQIYAEACILAMQLLGLGWYQVHQYPPVVFMNLQFLLVQVMVWIFLSSNAHHIHQLLVLEGMKEIQ